MSRLFTFGDSFTRFIWPTWANILGQAYDVHENWAAQAHSNPFILNRISECDTKNSLHPGDTVVIVWSEHLRSSSIVGKKWIYEKVRDGALSHCDEHGAITLSFNAINLAYSFLEAKGVTFYMSAIKPLQFECSEYYLGREVNLFDRFPQYAEILQRPQWLANFDGGVFDLETSMDQLKLFENDPFIERLHRSSNLEYNGIYYDRHPTVSMHWHWLKTTGLLDRLRVDKSKLEIYKLWQEQLTLIPRYEDIRTHFTDITSRTSIPTEY